MSRLKDHFPFFHWVVKTLSGRWARRIYLAILLFLLLISTTARLRAYFMTRKIEAVLHGLSEIRLDQTTEEQLTKMVPYLTEKDWKATGISYHSYYVHIAGSWENVRFQQTIPSPMDPTRQIANQIWPQTKVGQEVLYFGGLGFYSCRFIPATPSALDIVRNTPIPEKRPEDQIPRGLM